MKNEHSIPDEAPRSGQPEVVARSDEEAIAKGIDPSRVLGHPSNRLGGMGEALIAHMSDTDDVAAPQDESNDGGEADEQVVDTDDGLIREVPDHLKVPEDQHWRPASRSEATTTTTSITPTTTVPPTIIDTVPTTTVPSEKPDPVHDQ